MIRNYLAIAARNLLRHPAYSFINIIGLGDGLHYGSLAERDVRALPGLGNAPRRDRPTARLDPLRRNERTRYRRGRGLPPLHKPRANRTGRNLHSPLSLLTCLYASRQNYAYVAGIDIAWFPWREASSPCSSPSSRFTNMRLLLRGRTR